MITKDYDYLLIGDSHSNHYTCEILKEGSRVKISWLPVCMSFPNSMSKEQGILPSVNGNSWKQGCMQNYRVGLNDNKNKEVIRFEC